MKSWDDVKRTISSIPGDELEAIDFAGMLIAKIMIRSKDLKWIQAKLAEEAGLKQSAVARIESGAAIPRIETIQKLAKAVGLKLDLVVDEQAAATTA